MKENYLRRWICGWLEFIQGLIAIITLGFICPDFCYRYLLWDMKRQNKKFLEEQKKNNGRS